MVPTSKEVKSITTSYLRQARGRVAGCVGGEGLSGAGGSGREVGQGLGGAGIRGRD